MHTTTFELFACKMVPKDADNDDKSHIDNPDAISNEVAIHMDMKHKNRSGKQINE